MGDMIGVTIYKQDLYKPAGLHGIRYGDLDQHAHRLRVLIAMAMSKVDVSFLQGQMGVPL